MYINSASQIYFWSVDININISITKKVADCYLVKFIKDYQFRMVLYNIHLSGKMFLNDKDQSTLIITFCNQKHKHQN